MVNLLQAPPEICSLTHTRGFDAGVRRTRFVRYRADRRPLSFQAANSPIGRFPITGRMRPGHCLAAPPFAACQDTEHEENHVSPTKSAPAANLLLAALPRKDRQRLLAAGEPVELGFGDILAEPNERIRHVYFPTESFVSLITTIDERANLEVGLVGNEGMLGIWLILGIDVSPLRALVQGAGPALRLNAASFRRELEESSALQRQLKRYLYVVISQFAQTAVCTRFHVVEARLARWLLMTQDRAHSDQFHVTHEFLAYMLGVRRVGVTKAATSLQKRKLIAYSRGNVTILDRAGLKAASCRCYDIDSATYARTMA
jgi:CRP-like cAMP-binding protein